MTTTKMKCAEVVATDWTFTLNNDGSLGSETIAAAASIETARYLRRATTAIERLVIEVMQLKKQLKTGPRRRRAAARKGWEKRRARARSLEGPEESGE